MFETLALLVSVTSFVAILAILKKFNRKPPPESGYLNINTVVAIFSTILRVTLAYVVAEVIGQSKWLWMRTPRPIRHIQRFHDASTGAWGSLKFLHTTWKPMLTIVGALIVIASNAIGPFSQLAVTTDSCTEVGREDSAQLSTIQEFHELLDPLMSALAVNGLLYGGAGSSPATPGLFKCKSLNCTFGPSYPAITHTSVGFCNSCIDVNHSLKPFDRGANGIDYQFAEDTKFRLTSPIKEESCVFNMSLDTTPFRQQSDGDRGEYGKNATVSVIMFTTAGWPSSAETCDVSTVAANCTMYPCLRHYHSNVTNGLFQEKVISQTPLEYITSDV
ncbi:hypothetical protein CPLU01_04227 [Colletotrichum plurivorum]|uniref:Uncharacterized protein n=1 Tax=Colletotrichum plurivorum TaxID=2175906 RepID=A0A8H6KQS0_9PEZI|nr:hypothetical protein CPLU01_04227 [Colletotrichum plurivorum]